MKKTIGCSCLALSLLASGAWAAELDMNATTLMGFGEESTPGFEDKFRVPAVQYVRADVSKLGNENLSFHFYGWGGWQIDAGDTEGDLTQGYLSYRFPKANGYAKAGRFYEFQTTGVEQVDGVGFGADLAKGLRLNLFGGAPVKVDYDNKGDYIYGGKLAYRYQNTSVSRPLPCGKSVTSTNCMKRLAATATNVSSSPATHGPCRTRASTSMRMPRTTSPPGTSPSSGISWL